MLRKCKHTRTRSTSLQVAPGKSRKFHCAAFVNEEFMPWPLKRVSLEASPAHDIERTAATLRSDAAPLSSAFPIRPDCQ